MTSLHYSVYSSCIHQACTLIESVLQTAGRSCPYQASENSLQIFNSLPKNAGTSNRGKLSRKPSWDSSPWVGRIAKHPFQWPGRRPLPLAANMSASLSGPIRMGIVPHYRILCWCQARNMLQQQLHYHCYFPPEIDIHQPEGSRVLANQYILRALPWLQMMQA